MKLIAGKQIAQGILDSIKNEIQSLSGKPKLAVIQVGNDSGSNLYVSRKLHDAQYVGIGTEHLHFDDITFDEIQKLIYELNDRNDVHGFFIQLPFPVKGHIYELFNLIHPHKDIDGLNALNLGRIWQNDAEAFKPATVLAVMECLKNTGIDLEGKNVLIINHSVIVGKPLAGYLIGLNATVTIAHKHTQNLKELCLHSDVIVSATGRRALITSDMVKDGAILIDVGINKTEQGVFGDFDFQSFNDRDVWITPVPDGVGPLTRAMLLQNTLKAYKLQSSQP